jgi:hypothetical protein
LFIVGGGTSNNTRTNAMSVVKGTNGTNVYLDDKDQKVVAATTNKISAMFDNQTSSCSVAPMEKGTYYMYVRTGLMDYQYAGLIVIDPAMFQSSGPAWYDEYYKAFYVEAKPVRESGNVDSITFSLKTQTGDRYIFTAEAGIELQKLNI